MSKLTDLKPTELREYLQEEAPHLLSALGEENGGAENGSAANIESKILESVQEKLDEVFEGRELKEEAERSATSLQSEAHRLLEEAGRNGLPQGFVSRLKDKYRRSGDQIPGTLKLTEEEVEAETAPAEVIRERVEADIADAVELIRESGGNPAIRGLGSGGGEDGEKPPAPRNSAFRSFLRDSGDLKEGDESEEDQIKALVKEGRQL